MWREYRNSIQARSFFSSQKRSGTITEQNLFGDHGLHNKLVPYPSAPLSFNSKTYHCLHNLSSASFVKLFVRIIASLPTCNRLEQLYNLPFAEMVSNSEYRESLPINQAYWRSRTLDHSNVPRSVLLNVFPSALWRVPWSSIIAHYTHQKSNLHLPTVFSPVSGDTIGITIIWKCLYRLIMGLPKRRFRLFVHNPLAKRDFKWEKVSRRRSSCIA